MEQQTTVEVFDTIFLEQIKGRYVLQEPDDGQHVLKLLGIEIANTTVYRIKRDANSYDFWRTVLVALIDDVEHYKQALRWAAAAREELLNAESSDLYLFIVPVGCVIELETCINIESSELFCRKYVARPNETLKEMFNRSFLCRPKETDKIENIIDPLIAALAKTEMDFNYFSSISQDFWKSEILSDRSGFELAESLFTSHSGAPLK